ncbi:MAG: phosphatase PAP2 family protein [Candidatus Pacearchaeota archaeon]|nr:MAG: phosphatase PAP2 family protein [Candidatus Pacearchaeota archaeon]
MFVAFLSFYFDRSFFYIIKLIRNSVLTDFFLGISFFSSLIFIFIFLTALFIKEKRRKFILPLWLTLAFNVILSFILKILIQRQRPFQLDLISIIGNLNDSYFVWNFSFPSFQSMLVFSVLPFLNMEFKNLRYIWIVFSFLVAFSRIYLGLHFLSDVFLGGVVGYFIGFFVLSYFKKRNFDLI